MSNAVWGGGDKCERLKASRCPLDLSVTGNELKYFSLNDRMPVSYPHSMRRAEELKSGAFFHARSHRGETKEVTETFST